MECCPCCKPSEDLSVRHRTLNKLLRACKWCSVQEFYLQFLVPVVLASLGATGIMIGVTIAAETFGLAIMGLIIGRFINNRSRLALIVSLACSFKAISTGIIFLGFSLEQWYILLLGAFCKGLSRTMIRDSLRVIVADNTPFAKRSQYLGRLRASMGIGISIGCFVGFGWLSPASNPDIPWRNPNWPNEWWFKTIVAMIFFMICNLYAAIALPRTIKTLYELEVEEDVNEQEKAEKEKGTPEIEIEEQEHTANKDDDEEAAIENQDSEPEKSEKITMTDEQIKHGFIGLLVLMGIEAMVGSLMRPFIIVYLRERLAANSDWDLTIAYAPGGILSIIFAPLIGMLLDKKSTILPRFTLFVASLFGAGITVLFIYANQLVQVVFIIIFDFTVLTVAGLIIEKIISSISKKQRGTLFGSATFVEQICVMLGPIIGGLLWDYVAHTTPFWASVFVEALIAFAYIGFFWMFPLDATTYDRV